MAKKSQSLLDEVGTRRTFAIISHPDAGKTTLTEKLLMYGGAIQEAGAVKARRASRHATSDWLEIEKQRGISVSSSVMALEYSPYSYETAALTFMSSIESPVSSMSYPGRAREGG